MRGKMTGKKSPENGYVTLMVIWISAIIVVLSSGLVVYVKSQQRAVKNYVNYVKAYYIAYAGMNQIIFTDFSSERQLKLNQEDGITELNNGNQNVQFGEGYYSVFYEDEGGKANINTASVAFLKKLMDTLKINDSQKKAEAIVRWRREHEIFLNVEELGLIPELDTNDCFSLSSYFSVYSSNARFAGSLNINTASKEVLASYLEEFNAPSGFVNDIISKRPISSRDLNRYIRSKAPKMRDELVKFFVTDSNTKRVKVVAGINSMSFVKLNSVFNVSSGGGHERIFIRYFWQE